MEMTGSDSSPNLNIRFTSAGVRGKGAVSVARGTAVEEQSLPRLLVVDNDFVHASACLEMGRTLHCEVHTAASAMLAVAALRERSYSLVMLDLKVPGAESVLQELHSQQPETPIVVMTAIPTVRSAVDAIRLGAADYLTKPLSMEEFSDVLERTTPRRPVDQQPRLLRERLRTGIGMGPLIGRSPEMEKLYRILSKVAFTTHPVLILGESGTGKELVARSIHVNGPLASKPFVPIDCGALTPTLIESELFGYVRGAFTGANRSKTGLLAAAEGGTVFLDEIGELPLELQAKLLRALQEREVRPVGATQAVPISARVLAATNRDLAAMVASGRFRRDLYFRLNVINIRIPALRERKGDISLLAGHMLDRLRRENGMAYSFSNEAQRLLEEYDWPGNVRELEHAIERACTLSSGPLLHVSDFPTQIQGLQPYLNGGLGHQGNGAVPEGRPSSPVLSIAELEKQAILSTIRQLNGDKLMAARLLGIGKTTLYRKLKEYGLEEAENGQAGSLS